MKIQEPLSGAFFEPLQGVYKIVNRINNRVYVGESRQIPSRISEHFRKLKSYSHRSGLMQLDYDRYGAPSFTVEVIELVRGKENRLKKEEEYIRHYISKGYEIYNSFPGNELAQKASAQVRFRRQLKSRKRADYTHPKDKGEADPPRADPIERMKREWYRKVYGEPADLSPSEEIERPIGRPIGFLTGHFVNPDTEVTTAMATLISMKNSGRTWEAIAGELALKVEETISGALVYRVARGDFRSPRVERALGLATKIEVDCCQSCGGVHTFDCSIQRVVPK